MASGLAVFAWSIDSELVRQSVGDTLAAATAWARDGYDRAPVLMAGLALIVLLPQLALAGYMAGKIRTFTTRLPAQPSPMQTVVAAATGLGWPREAWIVVDGVEGPRRPVPREMLSLGREDDNDIRLDHATVHRHHAILHRTPEAHFIIRDLSGPRGNGVRVNGERIAARALEDGDRIEIGAVSMRFEAQLA